MSRHAERHRPRFQKQFRFRRRGDRAALPGSDGTLTARAPRRQESIAAATAGRLLKLSPPTQLQLQPSTPAEQTAVCAKQRRAKAMQSCRLRVSEPRCGSSKDDSFDSFAGAQRRYCNGDAGRVPRCHRRRSLCPRRQSSAWGGPDEFIGDYASRRDPGDMCYTYVA